MPIIPKINLQDISRSGHVTRWHSVRTLRNQTLAEHHYMVSMFVNKMSKEIPTDPISDSERLLLLEYAMWHDTPELLMGDLASPLKRRIEEISKKENPIEIIENEIAPWLTNLKDKIKKKPELYIIFKLADMMDAIIFIFQEGVGEHSKAVRKNLEIIFNKKVNAGKKIKPSYNWQLALTMLHDLLHATTNQLEFEIEDDSTLD